MEFDYLFAGRICDMLKDSCLKIIEQIPELQHILPEDFDVIVAKYDSGQGMDGKLTGGTMRFMNSYYMQWINYLSVLAGRQPVSPYVLTIYPIYFKQSKSERLRILVHELKHIPAEKRGCMAHTGFGDEDTVRLIEQNRPNLLEVV